MARPVTLFTGQWADPSLDDLRKKARELDHWGFALVFWAGHFEVDKAVLDAGDHQNQKKRDQLASRWHPYRELLVDSFAAAMLFAAIFLIATALEALIHAFQSYHSPTSLAIWRGVKFGIVVIDSTLFTALMLRAASRFVRHLRSRE